MRIDAANNVEFVGFTLADCTVDVDAQAARYLRVIHGTALELAVHGQFGAEVGGFWLLAPQIAQLRRLSEYYSPDEGALVDVGRAQLHQRYGSPRMG